MTAPANGAVDRPSVLMVVTSFSLEEGSSGLLRDLCDAIAGEGASVTVCFIDWTSQHERDTRRVTLANGVEVLIIPPVLLNGLGSLAKSAGKWLGSSYFAARAMRKMLRGRHFDLMIAFSPLVVSNMAIMWAKRYFRCSCYAYITDFFPYHQRGAGQNIGGRAAFRIGLALETCLLRKFQTIGCMSRVGVDFIRANYRLRADQDIEVLNLWGDTTVPAPIDRVSVRARHGIPINRPVVLFGGQIAEGRGIEEILRSAELMRISRPDVIFLFMGKGRLEPLVQEHIEAGNDNVMLKSPAARDEYLSIVAACDLGLVATVPGTGVPTFPSKTIDYLRAGIPIVASVEDTTDYGEFVSKGGFGVAVEAGHPEQLVSAIARLLSANEGRERMVRNARTALVKYFDVKNAARIVLRKATPLRRG